jgi:hypothetical protein
VLVRNISAVTLKEPFGSRAFAYSQLMVNYPMSTPVTVAKTVTVGVVVFSVGAPHEARDLSLRFHEKSVTSCVAGATVESAVAQPFDQATTPS